MSTAAITPGNLRVLVKMLTDVILSRYLSGAAVTLVIYDWSLLLEREYNTIWKSRWTFPKILYYSIRLFTIPFIFIAAYEWIDFRPALSNLFCMAWPSLITIPMFLTFAASNWLFTLRLIVLYRHQRALVWFMRIFFVCTYAVTLSFLLRTLVSYSQIGVYYNPAAKCCFSPRTVSTTAAVFYTPALYEFLIFALTAYRAHQDAILLNTGSTQLLVVLYRDNVIGFFIMLAMRSWNVWIHLTQPVSSMHVATNIYWAVNTVLSTRVYLNIVWSLRQTLAPNTLNSGPSLVTEPSPTIGGSPSVSIGLRHFSATTDQTYMQRSPIEYEGRFADSTSHLVPNFSRPLRPVP
ncbi:hypothetical protein M408DRAFT_215963 [Serendipita vermifera MAFF 305830]|uniref:DUF6533 domain-containing protein n=1 Tax=Serendipita vermifera MAFF 305830 TaxID=933852 RepID=A0A0C3B5Z7_SERVB|nr:hypothetical protein M408DRAFT_215963 [Serendipita vermifera MAFF 305830]